MTPSRTAQEARTPDEQLLTGLEDILKSGADGELRRIARRAYLDLTNEHERKEIAA